MRYAFNGEPQPNHNNDYGVSHPVDSNGMYRQLSWNEPVFNREDYPLPYPSTSDMVTFPPASYNDQVFDKNHAIVNNPNAMQQHKYVRPTESEFPASQVDSQPQIEWMKTPETSSYGAQQGLYPNADAGQISYQDSPLYPDRQQMAYMQHQHSYDDNAFYPGDMPGQMEQHANFGGFASNDEQGVYQNLQNEYPSMPYAEEMQMPAENKHRDARYMPVQSYDNQQQPTGQYNDFFPQQDGNAYQGIMGYQTPQESGNTPFQQFSQQQQNISAGPMQNTPMSYPQQQMKQSGMMSYFQDDKGQLDVDKMLSTVGHAANTFQQITPVVKGLGSIISAFRK